VDSNSDNIQDTAQLTSATSSFEIIVNASVFFLFLVVRFLADDDGGALARRSSPDEVALMLIVEVHSDAARVVDAGRLAVRDRLRLVSNSTDDVTVCHGLPDVRTTSATQTYSVNTIGHNTYTHISIWKHSPRRIDYPNSAFHPFGVDITYDLYNVSSGTLVTGEGVRGGGDADIITLQVSYGCQM